MSPLYNPSSQYDKDNAQSGVYGTPMNVGPNNTQVLTANRLYVTRFTVSRPMTILTGSFGVAAIANNDDSCMIGIYDATLANLLASSVSTAGKLTSTTGPKIISLQASVTLVPRTAYYSAFILAAAGTAATVGTILLGSGAIANLYGASQGATAVGPTIETAFAAPGSLTLPTPAGALTASTACPVIAWREF